MHGELTDLEFPAIPGAVGSKAGERKTRMDEFTVQGSQGGFHALQDKPKADAG
jgi:hypothetical protein